MIQPLDISDKHADGDKVHTNSGKRTHEVIENVIENVVWQWARLHPSSSSHWATIQITRFPDQISCS